MLNSRFRIPPVFLVLFILSGIFFILLVGSRGGDREDLKKIKKIAAFTLIDQDGKVFSSDILNNKVAVYNFIFTNCAGICPVMTYQMKELHLKFSPEQNVRFISITVDPERDTPEVLFNYAQQTEANTAQWSFLTGPKADIYELSRKEFLLGVEEDGGSLDELIMHSQKFVLVDGDAYIRGYYDGFDEEALNKLYIDASNLLNITS